MEKQVLLIILDGYGISKDLSNNAIEMAKKPNIDRLLATYPHSLLSTSGSDVGLPEGIMGNSEVGHLNIGGGRIIRQELSKIADFAKENGFESLHEVKRVICDKAGSVHLLGLVSDGGVHSHQEHLYLLLEAAKRINCDRPVYIDVITDGRDTPPKSALNFVRALEREMKRIGKGQISSISGRFYTMDRDKRWERTQVAYEALTSDHASPDLPVFNSASEAIEDAYAKGETDEFIKPRLVKHGRGIHSEDGLIFFNFRADRARQICRALAVEDFREFDCPIKISHNNLLTFTRYGEEFLFPVLFPPQPVKNILGEIVSQKGGKQLRIAETEKYAHVTYFFNGGEERVFPGEERLLVQSPKDVKTYDLKPEMSARKLTDELLKKMQSEKFKLIVLNFANSDMVGHTGNTKAAIEAIEVLDECIGRIIQETKAQGYDVLITSDHGNSECMVDPKTGAPHTAHTTNPVPLIWVPSEKDNNKGLSSGILADIAPTILDLFGWQKPSEMTGHSLIQ